jgi:hypothetical protein
MRVISVLLLLVYSSLAHARELKGFITTKEGNRVSGTVVIGGNAFMPDGVAMQFSIGFREGDGKKKRLTPRDIQGFGIVNPDNSDTHLYKTVVYLKKTNPVQKQSEVTVFMEVISGGALEMYYFIDYVAGGQRASAQAALDAEGIFIRKSGEAYASRIPRNRLDEGYTEPMNYYQFIRTYLGTEHPLLNRVSPGLSLEQLVKAIQEFNRTN